MIVVNGKKLEFFSSIDEIVNLNRNGVYISIAAESLASSDSVFEAICNSKDSICYADGELAVIALKKNGYKQAVKIPGVELWLEFLKRTPLEDTYIIGTSEVLIRNVVKKVCQEFGSPPKYYRNGFLNEHDIVEVEHKLILDKPSLVVLAMGQPRQEIVAKRLFNIHEAKYICVGGALDVYSGVIKRAPKILINLKLEWFYRLLMEPRRITRQFKMVPTVFKVLFTK